MYQADIEALDGIAQRLAECLSEAIDDAADRIVNKLTECFQKDSVRNFWGETMSIPELFKEISTELNGIGNLLDPEVKETQQ